MVCDLLDTFTADVASQAAGFCRSRGSKIVTRDDLRFSLGKKARSEQPPLAYSDSGARGIYLYYYTLARRAKQ